jgi:hypothetical protein
LSTELTGHKKGSPFGEPRLAVSLLRVSRRGLDHALPFRLRAEPIAIQMNGGQISHRSKAYYKRVTQNLVVQK